MSESFKGSDVKKYILQICAAIDDYLLLHAKALYTVYSLTSSSDDEHFGKIELGEEAQQQEGVEVREGAEGFEGSYEELIPRERGFLRRFWTATRRGSLFIHRYLQPSMKWVGCLVKVVKGSFS